MSDNNTCSAGFLDCDELLVINVQSESRLINQKNKEKESSSVSFLLVVVVLLAEISRPFL